MSFGSSLHSTATTSPSSSMASQPISISSMRSTRSSLDITERQRTSTTSTQFSSCWKTSSGVPSAYISDEDLFGDDDDEPYLSEPPPPPRPAQMWAPLMAQPLLPPVTKTRVRMNSQKKEKKGKSPLATKG